MLKTILLVGAAAAAVLWGLVGLVIGGARGQTPAAILSETDGCRLPCWNGITPGQTIIRDATQILRANGFVYFEEPDDLPVPGQQLYVSAAAGPVCQVGLTRTRTMEAVVREVALWFCQPQALGDLLPVVGTPGTLLPLTSLLAYDQGQIVLILAAPVCDGRITPHSKVLYVSLSDDSFNAPLYGQPVKFPWRGFMPLWRYGQVYGESPC